MPERYAVDYDPARKAFIVWDRRKAGREVARAACTCEAHQSAVDRAAWLNRGEPQGSTTATLPAEGDPWVVSPEDADRYLTVKEFARAQGVSEWTVRRWVRRNGLPHVKMGEIRIPPNALDLLRQPQMRTPRTPTERADIEADILSGKSTAPGRRRNQRGGDAGQ